MDRNWPLFLALAVLGYISALNSTNMPTQHLMISLYQNERATGSYFISDPHPSHLYRSFWRELYWASFARDDTSVESLAINDPQVNIHLKSNIVTETCPEHLRNKYWMVHIFAICCAESG